MKVLLYFEKANALKQSGIGRALRHQKKALESIGVEVTLDSKDTYDIAHINTLFNKSYKLLKKCNKKNIPVVVHGHSTVEDFRESFRCWKLVKGSFYRCLFKMYRNAKYIITPTPYSKNLIENYKGVNAKVYDLSNGIDLDEYKRNEESIKKFREYFNLKDSDKVVIGVGLFFHRKGIEDFFSVARKMKDTKFIWFGNLAKILTQPKILKEIKHRPENVIMPGYIDGDIIKGAFQNANCLLFPSFEETEGIVVLEALASKIPVIVRNIGVYEPWLVDNVNCLKASNVDGFIDKINYCFNNDTTNLINEGYKVAENRSIDKIGIKLKEIYETVIEETKKTE